MIRVVAIAALLTFAVLLCLFTFNAAIQPSPSNGPVERWIQAGIDLHRLDELNSMNLFRTGEYEARYEQVLSAATHTAHHSEFPGTNEAYIEYTNERFRALRWPPVFWFMLATALIVSVAAFSWVHGVTMAMSLQKAQKASGTEE